MSTKDSLGDRMKENYENRYRMYLTRRTPVIIRIDGKAFHSFTRYFKRPFDMVFKKAMWGTARALCSEIMGCQLAYVQSDEISLLLVDYKKLTSQAWFDYNLQKVCSISASMATMFFNNLFRISAIDFEREYNKKEELSKGDFEEYKKLIKTYFNVCGKAMFDARAFNIPESEVCNYFIWRQQDATRNSIEMLGRCYFSQKELHKVNCSQIQDKLVTEKGVNWNDCPTFFKRGVCITKNTYISNEGVSRSDWGIDVEIPIFTQDRRYIEKYLQVEES